MQPVCLRWELNRTSYMVFRKSESYGLKAGHELIRSITTGPLRFIHTQVLLNLSVHNNAPHRYLFFQFQSFSLAHSFKELSQVKVTVLKSRGIQKQ